jgi:hypothetical protein
MDLGGRIVEVDDQRTNGLCDTSPCPEPVASDTVSYRV